MSKMPRKVKAHPEKAFFVKTITRDITLEDSILELIDNSIDGAWKCEGSRPTGLAENVKLSKYKISITLNKHEFTISDNCGGMSLDEAVEYAFSFGRKDDEDNSDYSIGVYGIGMKRAIFKLGKKISIESTPLGATGFKVPIDVNAWLARSDESWDFDLEELDKSSKNGVFISVSQLTPETQVAFESSNFLPQLRQIIARDYALYLKQGLDIEVNGEKIKGWNIEFRKSRDFAPVRLNYVDESTGNPVTVEIIGGMVDTPLDNLEPSGRRKEPTPYGWYIICNGRVVLAADKTEISGWGKGLPKWHQQYAGFIGVVVLSAKNASDLPLTTTKRSVDQASGIFQKAKQEIKKISRAWVDYTNLRINLKKGGEEGESRVDKLESTTKPISIYDVTPRKDLKLPKFRRNETEEKRATVTYSVLQKRAKALAIGMGSEKLSCRDIGLRSFEYAYKKFVNED